MLNGIFCRKRPACNKQRAVPLEVISNLLEIKKICVRLTIGLRIHGNFELDLKTDAYRADRSKKF
jgi:hypothetical protein